MKPFRLAALIHSLIKKNIQQMGTNTIAFHAMSEAKRQQSIIQVFTSAFGEKIKADPSAWRGKFRKMSATPFAFYRGSAVLFFQDMARMGDQDFLNEKTSRVWIHGDLHAENFGTYMNGKGKLVFDVNDFDEAWVAPFTWDIKRLGASLALIGFSKAMSDDDIRQVVAKCIESYVRQVADFAEDRHTKDFALTLDNTTGKLHEVLQNARLNSRIALLDMVTEIKDYDRRLKIGKINKALPWREKRKVESAFRRYLKTIPQNKLQSSLNYEVKDICEVMGAGIGSVGYKMYSVLMEGPNQALENDIVISIKVGQVPAASRVTDNGDVHRFFKNHGHRTVLSQRALQAYSDPWIGHTTIGETGYFVAEFSPYNADLEWDDVNDLDDMLELVTYLGQAVAKIHCVSDVDSDEKVVPFSTDQALHDVLSGNEKNFVEKMTTFGMEYGNVVRDDHRLFVDAFRNHQFDGL